jgi:hypothetical protein
VSQQTTNRTFDELASGLASGTLSRGKALKLMGAALLGGTLASLGGVAAADDECKPVDKKCRKDHQCCSGKCSGGKCAAAGGGICPTGGSCDTTFPFGCQNNQSCFCTTTTEGTTFCSQSIACGPNVFCTSTQDCPSGWVCSDTCCDGRGKICNPPCGTFPGVAASSADNQGMSGH